MFTDKCLSWKKSLMCRCCAKSSCTTSQLNHTTVSPAEISFSHLLLWSKKCVISSFVSSKEEKRSLRSSQTHSSLSRLEGRVPVWVWLTANCQSADDRLDSHQIRRQSSIHLNVCSLYRLKWTSGEACGEKLEQNQVLEKRDPTSCWVMTWASESDQKTP